LPGNSLPQITDHKLLNPVPYATFKRGAGTIAWIGEQPSLLRPYEVGLNSGTEWELWVLKMRRSCVKESNDGRVMAWPNCRSCACFVASFASSSSRSLGLSSWVSMFHAAQSAPFRFPCFLADLQAWVPGKPTPLFGEGRYIWVKDPRKQCSRLKAWSPHMSFILKGSQVSAFNLKGPFKSKTSIQEYIYR
jgi:hypothetical protein